MSEARGERGQSRAAVAEPGSLRRSLAEVAFAIVAAPFRRLSTRASQRLITVCGLWALVCPLLLWISWSRTGFLILIASVAIAVAVIYLLTILHPDDPF